MYSDYEITQLPLSLKSARKRLENFLAKNGLRLDEMDYYAVVTRLGDDKILAGGGLKGDIIKCIAVDDSLRGTGMGQRLVSHLLSVANGQGHLNIKVYTKPLNTDIFTSLSFRLLASAPQAVLLENGLGGLEQYKDYLARQRSNGTNGIIVMNCNPFTRGHHYLVEQAAAQVDNLYVIIVKEDVSTFSYPERLFMTRYACADVDGVIVCDGSDYCVSAATFPTYFLKELNDASDTQMTLDLDLFARHIAPSLGATVRFVGTEPDDELTRRYNELMKQLLPARGIDVVEIDRLSIDGKIVSASTVRTLLDNDKLPDAIKLVPPSTVPRIIAKAATNALEQELATTPKPGLVDTHDNGAHNDMDYDIMTTGLQAIAPYFVDLATIGYIPQFPQIQAVQEAGIKAEAAMLRATGGVNTHRGALFSLGLAVVGVAHSMHNGWAWTDVVKQLALQLPDSTNSNGAVAAREHKARGALAMAREGYTELCRQWLPYYRSAGTHAQVKTLLLIMSQLDDTNVIHRVGYQRAQQVKEEARNVLDDFDISKVEAMNREFTAQNISPGGAADMLALTIFANSFTNDNSTN